MQNKLTQASLTHLFSSDPEWMFAIRREALAQFESLPMPNWDRTRFKDVQWEQVEPFAAAKAVNERAQLPAPLQAHLPEPSETSGLLVQIDSSRTYTTLASDLQAKGVILTDLGTAAREHPELVRKYLFQAVATNETKFTALHAAFMSGGAFVYVPPRVDVELPIQLSAWSETDKVGLFRHVLVVVDRSASLNLVDTTSSVDRSGRLVTNVVELFAEEGAFLKYAAIQNFGEQTTNYTIRRAVTGRDAQVEWVLGDFGSLTGRMLNESLLKGVGSGSKSLAVFFGSGNQHLDIGVTMRHIGEHTSGDMLTKGVLTEQGRVVYRGLTDIEATGRDASSYQRENTLILSDRARADAIPGLEIENNNVAAGHAATIGQVDEEYLFYLMSRGLSRIQASKLIVDGFFAPIMQQVPLDAVKAELQRLIDRKMLS